MGKKWQWLAIASISVALMVMASGCGKTKVKTDEAVVAPPADQQVIPPAERPPDDPGMAMRDEPLETQRRSSGAGQLILEGRTSAPLLPVYYDFDKSDIRADQQPRLEDNGAYLKDNRGVSIRIEGNCDERGTNEYNLALGERRALSAKKYLVNLGIDGRRVDTLSYGEVKPLVRGHDELAWAQNRRADFVILD